MKFIPKFFHYLFTTRLIGRGDRLIVAVSGGADSIALLYALYCFRQEFGLDLIVAHYDHRLRPSSSLDGVYVKNVAKTLGLSFIIETNRKKIPTTGSTEEFAREQRYDFLFRSAKKHEADGIVTAHTSDDLAETVLMRLLRGTGLAGLQAILPRRQMRGVNLIRPFLFLSREEIEAFLKEIKVGYINDPTNQSLDFTRNKIRRILIPFLKKEFGHNISENISNLAFTAAVDYGFIESQSLIHLKQGLRRANGNVYFPLDLFYSLHPSIRRMVLRSAYAALYGTPKPLTLAHVEALDLAFADQRLFPKICLPKQIICERRKKMIMFSFVKTSPVK
ncbi:MAG: tRNA lysidine(34) synthetase TilS [Candidatus Omnitrophica bacterium]|nr:tRNA lysidine(34) synthetase TilS [Candidatus Omnitrophota bacterium]